MNTISAVSQHILHFANTVPALIADMDGQQFCEKPAPGKWSKKEILGHLVDSAANNHQRIIRAQYEYVPVISYDQDKWNTHNNYNDLPVANIIDLWVAYNRHLASLIMHIPHEGLQRNCDTGDNNITTFERIIIDYVRHMEHHLKQITG